MVWIILAGIAAGLFYYYLIKPHQYWADKGVKQSTPVVVFGDLWRRVFRLQSPAEFAAQVYNMYPGTRYSGFYQFYLPTLILKDPDLIKQITVKDFDHFTDHMSNIDPETNVLWGKNLFSLRGKPWKEMRGTLSGSFTSSKMRHMFGLIQEASNNLVEHFLKKGERIINVEMKGVCSRFTNDVIATTAFGVKVDSLEYPNNKFYKMGQKTTDFTGWWRNIKLFSYIMLPTLSKVLKINLFGAEVENFFRNLINDTVKAREENGIIRPDMINILIEARKGNAKEEENGIIDRGFAVVHESPEIVTKTPKYITNEDITGQAMIFFFAGFDAVSSLMCFLAYELAVHQDIQKRLREEIKDTSVKYKGNLTYEALLKMEYMDMVVSEALRKWPVPVVVDRVCTKPYTIQPATPEEKPLDIKVGDVLWLPIFGIHRDPEHYPEPEKFDPERFSEENKVNIKPYTYIPFGSGPRNCIGSRFVLLETKTVFYHFLSKFEILPNEKTQIPIQLSKKSVNMVAEDGFWFTLKRVES